LQKIDDSGSLGLTAFSGACSWITLLSLQPSFSHHRFDCPALYRKEKRFAKRIAAEHRTISFTDFVQAFEVENGTLICEWKSVLKGPVRWWWAGDDVLAKSPFSVPDRASWTLDGHPLPFRRWCFDEYIDPSGGKARLVYTTTNERKLLRERLKDVRRIDVLTFATEGW
jgi:hypothetical protein